MGVMEQRSRQPPTGDASKRRLAPVAYRGHHGLHVWWDPALIEQAMPSDEAVPDRAWFDASAWAARGDLLNSARGRGEAYFLRASADMHWVLRHFRRGGLAARWNRDRYLWRAAKHTRCAREFRLLSALWAAGLPVPRPVAALAQRSAGVFYRADLITVAVPQAQPLAERLMSAPLSQNRWQRIGGVIAQLHAQGVWHADLNARNLLIDAADAIFIIDFDRARRRVRLDDRRREGNLTRLRRSLDKFVSQEALFYFTDADWRALVTGYEAGWSARL